MGSARDEAPAHLGAPRLGRADAEVVPGVGELAAGPAEHLAGDRDLEDRDPLGHADGDAAWNHVVILAEIVILAIPAWPVPPPS
jgi:hypothetical protein